MIVLKTKTPFPLPKYPNQVVTIFCRVASVTTSFIEDKAETSVQYYYNKEGKPVILEGVNDETLKFEWEGLISTLLVGDDSSLNSLSFDNHQRAIYLGVQYKISAGNNIFGTTGSDWELYDVPEVEEPFHIKQVMN